MTNECPDGESVERTPSHKRAATQTSNPSVKRRRSYQNTPECTAMTQPVATSSPVVSVIQMFCMLVHCTSIDTAISMCYVSVKYTSKVNIFI